MDTNLNIQNDSVINPRDFQFLFSITERAYLRYLDEGQKFVFADVLRKYNVVLRDKILQSLHALPPDLVIDAVQLVIHIETWLRLWDESFAVHKPTMRDYFAFENSVVFPKESALRLIDYFS